MKINSQKTAIILFGITIITAIFVVSQGTSQVFTGISATLTVEALLTKHAGLTALGPIETSTDAFTTDPTQAALGTPAALCDNYSSDPLTVDVTIQDGTAVAPGQEFIKTWKIKNTGVCAWGDGYGLVYSYGERMNGEPVSIGFVEAGGEVEVSVNFKAPIAVGEYTSAWQMANAKGITFGKALFVKIIVKASTPTPEIIQTPNQTQTLQAAFFDIDRQFENSLKGNIAFNKPDQMKKDETASIELILSTSLSESALATQLVGQSSFATSPADPNILLSPNGASISIETSQIEITQRMKATLKSQDPEAFVIEEMHDNAEQVISSMDVTTWRWSIIAKNEGPHTLELVVYQLVKYDGKEFWHEVKTYKADIVVEVTASDRFKSLDWKWMIGVIFIPLIGAAWGWWRNRKKKSEVIQVKILDDTKDTKIKGKKKR